MSLVINVYNKLHSRDELVFCPSCGRILYIPEDLPPETAIHSVKASAGATKRKATPEQKAATEPCAKGRWGQLLSAAQGESVKAAMDAQNEPLTFQVMVNGELAGHYKGKSRENLQRIIDFRMGESNLTGQVEVVENAAPTGASESASAETVSTESNAEPLIAQSGEADSGS